MNNNSAKRRTLSCSNNNGGKDTNVTVIATTNSNKRAKLSNTTSTLSTLINEETEAIAIAVTVDDSNACNHEYEEHYANANDTKLQCVTATNSINSNSNS